MATPVRFPSGISTQAPYRNLADAGFPDPFKYQVYANDFQTLNATDFTVTDVGINTTALTAEDGGVALTTTSAGATDASYHQLTAASFVFTPTSSNVFGKRAFFRARLKISDATNTAIHAGLIVTSATPQAPTDGLYFLKAAGATTFILRSTVASVSTDLAITGFNFANATYIDFGFSYDGTNVRAFVNDTVNKGVVAAFAPVLTTALLTPSWGIKNGAAAIKTLSTDFILAATER